MDGVRNHSSIHQNQSYLDDVPNQSKARPAKSEPRAPQPGATMSCPPPAASLRSEAPAKPRAPAAVGYTGADGSSQVSDEAVNQLVQGRKSSTARPTPQSPSQPPEKSLCDKRKAANQFLCGILGSVAAARSVPAKNIKTGVAVSTTIAETCKRTADWLEENAPGGACGKR